MQFELSCHVRQGRLLSILAGGRPGGLIGETGTGCGVGLAWMLSSSDAGTQLVSVEADPDRAAAARRLFAEDARVTVICDDWEAIVAHGPFDLLVLDGGGAGKARADERRVDPRAVLRPGGTLVMDDWTPWEVWPPTEDGEFDRSRLHWLEHPDLLATEIRLSPTLSTIVATRR
jgi:predicted O-methyltransferase YrrM